MLNIRKASRELTTREQIKATNFNNAKGLATVLDNTDCVTLSIDWWVLCHVELEATHEQYDTLVIMTTDGQKYTTSSETFIKNFEDMMDLLKDDNELIEIDCCKGESKNYKGKYYLTCTLH